MNEIALRNDNVPNIAAPSDPTGGRLVAWAQSLGAAHQIASALCQTAFVPKHFAGKPDEAAAALILGDELGFSPVSALRSIFVISGTPGLYARSMVALVQSQGHEVWTETDTPNKVTVAGRRKNSDNIERAEWTIDRARRAGYTNNKKYETDPQAMLYARAASDVCRKIAADVLAGVPYSVEELELETKPAATRTVRRAAAPETPEPDPQPEAVPESSTESDATRRGETRQPEPDTITPSQLKKLGAQMREAGITQRQDALDYVTSVIDRTVESRNDLTKDEASRVIDALDALAALEKPKPAETTEQPEQDEQVEAREPTFDDQAWTGGKA